MLGAAVLMVTACGSSGGGTATAGGSLVAMTYPGMMQGLTPTTSPISASATSLYPYYEKVWRRQLPHLKVTELQVPDEATAIANTLQGEREGDPPDLIGLHDTLPELVRQGALTDLTPYFRRAGITPGDFLPGVAASAREDGRWYALPGASNPTAGDLLVIPSDLRAAGLDPDNLPRTWNQLLQESVRVTKFGPGHTLERIGEPVMGVSDIYAIDEYCGGPAIWTVRTGYQAASSCIESYFEYEMELVDAYGGWSAYESFIGGDPGPWSCSPEDYVASGKVLLDLDSYATGAQLDRCYDLTWKLGYAPSQNGEVNPGLEQTNWMLAIPRGAKNPQAAFDFWLTTYYEHGDLAAPTTEGYTRPGQVRAWDRLLTEAQARIRTRNHFAGNPMAGAVGVVASEAAASDTTYPGGTETAQYATIMSDAWDDVANEDTGVGPALSRAQRQIDALKANP